jgi:deoxyribodipyrimidine photolyase-related protein
MEKTLRLVLGDQLNKMHSWYARKEEEVIYVLIELRSETDYVRHHLQKILFFFGAIEQFAQWLRSEGHQVVHLNLDHPLNKKTLGETIPLLLTTWNCSRFEYQCPDEYRLKQELNQLALSIGKDQVKCLDTEHFLIESMEFSQFFAGRKTYLMEPFYRYMRKKYQVLMNGSQPEGDRWNFDAENRKALPDGISVPEPLVFDHDLREIMERINRHQINHFGEADAQYFKWPLCREEAVKMLDYFVLLLLPKFGVYEDAMHTKEHTLFHSRLSLALNSKMLQPLEVIKAVEKAYHANPEYITLPQAEGFIRQILGWREYMRGIYWEQMPGFAQMNFFNHKASLPSWYWTGNTKMNCLRYAIRQSLHEAWAHHIQRLMVTGNFALLLGVHPDEVDQWYLGIYIDAIEWVEITNTRGMSQYADGGIVGSKPYVSSGNYIHKMSNYCKGCAYDVKKRTGKDACPFNSLYWDFHQRHRALLEKNPRIGMVYRSWDKFTAEEQKYILAQAAEYRSDVENL